MNKKGNYHRKRINGKVRFIVEGESEHKLTNSNKKSNNKLTKGDLIICETCDEPCWEFLGKIDDTGFNRYKRLECACDYHQIRAYGARLEWRE